MTDDAGDWFASAVFYEVLVRSFADSNGDGIGDLPGLIGKLDYLADLGVDCLWLPPFFPSPLRDGGYDVADYRGVQPELGTIDDIRALLDAAHDRGMRVITDFVMNHTSDEHPWFQASRNDPDGPYGDFYVWRPGSPDSRPTEYADARVIFIDSLDSNWSYDEVRGAWFWHRFYPFQPDLNFENPRVLEEILDAVRFWLALGVDGFRLDAVPYLIEQDGTNGENLPGTHAILKQLRAMVDAEFPGKILLCEANQWPSDVIEYFGDGDECQMAFNFPVMPRLYMGLRQGDRSSISQILADTPPLPPGCQWGTFLRNHDELTLEMVTPDERDYMWREYAPDERMKCNLGIRRRLAPLVDADQRRIRVLHAMLLALPGAPCLYYGDEIGMGDNIWLPDRDGVRTPMQWDDSDGAGFSTADPAAVSYPLITDELFGPGRVNVAAQQADPASQWHWLKGTLALRAGLPSLSTGDFVDLEGPTEVFSFARALGDERIVAANNLTDAEQTVDLTLPDGWTGVAERVHGAALSVSQEEGGLQLTLPPFGYVWLQVAP